MVDEDKTITSIFKEFFSVELAKTKEQKSKVFHIRYRVYCDEFGYESAEHFENQEETDEYDEFSSHCLIIHKKTKLPAGCVRLVPAFDNQNLPKLLPLEQHCQSSLDQKFLDGLDLDRSTICEISRLAVDGLFRRRPGEGLTRFGETYELDCTQTEQRSFPLISIAAFLAATALTDKSGKTNVFAMMEPFLPRMMKRSGIIFNKAGYDMDYHGIRAPYFGQTQPALENMKGDLQDLYLWIYKQLGDYEK